MIQFTRNRFLGLNGLICCSLVLLFPLSCRDVPEQIIFREKLNRHRKIFEREAEAFFRQGKIRNISRVDDATYNIEGDIVTLKNQRFQDSTLNIREVQIKKHKYFTSFDQFLRMHGISREEFFGWADFLRKYDLFALTIDSRLVWVAFYGGFLGSESGFIYVPVGNEHAINYFYPKWPRSIDHVEKIDDRWYYYVE